MINYQDKDAGIISGRFASEYESEGYMNDGKSDIEVEVRDQRFKITLESRETRTYGLKSLYMIDLSPDPPSPWSSIRWQHDLELRGIESLKIHCAGEHFKEISGAEVKFATVSNYEGLMEIVQLN